MARHMPSMLNMGMLHAARKKVPFWQPGLLIAVHKRWHSSCFRLRDRQHHLMVQVVGELNWGFLLLSKNFSSAFVCSNGSFERNPQKLTELRAFVVLSCKVQKFKVQTCQARAPASHLILVLAILTEHTTRSTLQQSTAAAAAVDAAAAAVPIACKQKVTSCRSISTDTSRLHCELL
jgi:hypothetical protein